MTGGVQGLLPAGQVRDVVRHAVELPADALMPLSLSGHPLPGDGFAQAFEQAFQVCHSFPQQAHLLALGVHALPKVLSLGLDPGLEVLSLFVDSRLEALPLRVDPDLQCARLRPSGVCRRRAGGQRQGGPAHRARGRTEPRLQQSRERQPLNHKAGSFGGYADTAEPTAPALRDTLPGMAFDTHAAVKTLTGAGAKEELAVAVVDIARQASAEHDRELATRADLANLKADLTWRLVAAMAAIGAILRFVG